MLLLFSILLITLAGAMQVSEDCEGGLISSCNFRPISFPESEEELDNFCRVRISHLECVVDFLERCAEHPSEQGVARGFLASLRDVCNKDNILNAVAVENLQCYKHIFEDEDISRVCNYEYPGMETRRQYNQALIQAGIATFEGNETIRCVATVYTASCYALQLKKCGKTATEAYIEIVHKFLSGSDICGKETTDVFPTIIEVIINEGELAENVGEALKKKK